MEEEKQLDMMTLLKKQSQETAVLGIEKNNT
jgi:hypothetical protein